MSDFETRMAPVESDPIKDLRQIGRWLILLLALANYGLVLAMLVTGWHPPGKPGWPEACLAVTATLATLAIFARHLPVQNTLMAAFLVAGIGAVAHSLTVQYGIPFGPLHFTEAAGPRFANLVAWFMPLIWVCFLFNSRGVTRLILRPWRKVRAYGFWLIGLTVLLSVLLAAALEPYAGAGRKYWLWSPTRLPLTWGGAPLTNFLGWAVTAILMLAFAAPVLIDKRPRSVSRPPDYQPLIAWLMMLALFATGAGIVHAWMALAYCAVTGMVTSIFAVRGARW